MSKKFGSVTFIRVGALAAHLLLKGLEGEVAVITSPEEMDARHLYVAMTRGSSRLIMCSLTPILTAH
ncbi:hypothetical protein D9H52_02745 [Escherichia coli]|nr:hypothetical protein BWI76_14350 [Klebsiella sp. M5al]EEW1459611.1 hypothetical protein [Escherichia coli]EFN4253744.1 hypothetical protein [Escherichia coli]MGR61036.1 hypothetical protein [Escherichia coli]MGS67515.1 hypothetical protein [Escherichia coli]